MNDRRQQLIPVEKSGVHFVVSTDWIRAGVPFPDVEEAPRLRASGYVIQRGNVHIDGASRAALIFLPPQDDDQTFAQLAHHIGPEDEVKIERSEILKYASHLRETYEYSEAVLPGQRARIESEFVEPDLDWLGRPGSVVTWGDVRRRSHILILGAPGSGKTTLLRSWLLWQAERSQSGESDLLPICVQLRDLRSGEPVWDALRRAVGHGNAAWTPSDLVNLAKAGRLALGFDGVDEVPAEDRSATIRDIQAFSDEFPSCRYLVTSRAEVDVRLNIGLERFRVRPFNRGRLREMAYHRLYQDDAWRAFTARVEAEPALGDLFSNPLAYSLILTRFSNNEIAPSYITEVVESIIELFIDSWDSSRGITREKKHGFSRGLKHKILAMLAAEVEVGARGRNPSLVLEKISKLVPNLAPAQTLRVLNEHTGLLSIGDDGWCEFKSSSVEKYFVASNWVSSINDRSPLFGPEILRSSQSDSSLTARYIGFLSIDACETIEEILSDSNTKNVDVVINLTNILAQKMVVPPSTISGYINLTVALLLRVSATNVPRPFEEAAGSVEMLLSARELDAIGVDFGQIRELIFALYRGRDGVGGAALRNALALQDAPFFSSLVQLLSVEGELVVSADEDGVRVKILDLLSSQSSQVRPS